MSLHCVIALRSSRQALLQDNQSRRVQHHPNPKSKYFTAKKKPILKKHFLLLSNLHDCVQYVRGNQLTMTCFSLMWRTMALLQAVFISHWLHVYMTPVEVVEVEVLDGTGLALWGSSSQGA